MIFKGTRSFKIFLSRLMFGIYFFALFSQTFHDHDFSDTLKVFNLKKSENSISKTDGAKEKADCLACHFIATGNVLLPEEFSYAIIQHTQDATQSFSVQEKVWSNTKFTRQLRGPPSFI